MTKQYKVHYTADVWMCREIEANSAEKAKEIFETQSEGWDENDAEEMGMENVKVDLVEEVK
mgnify:FL=1|jgi:hypothetical protein|tara:strand:- start:384 stop:566 length:183 start_codon:yes stop_codon:yes gene_type:complete